MCVCVCVCVCVCLYDVTARSVVVAAGSWMEMDVPVAKLPVCDGVKTLLGQLLSPQPALRLTTAAAAKAVATRSSCRCRLCGNVA